MSTKYLSSIESTFINGIGKELCWGWSPAVDFINLLDGRISSSSSADEEVNQKSTTSNTASTTSTSNNHSNKKAAVVGFDEDGFPIVSSEAPSKNTDDEKTSEEANNDKKPINILLVGAADVRHIIMTLSRINRTELGRSKRPIHFYIFEPSLRVHCRHLLFLQLLLVDLVTLSELEDRVSTVLEIYGNSLLRDISAGVLKNAALAVCNALDFEEDDDDEVAVVEKEEGEESKNKEGDDGDDAAAALTTSNQEQKAIASSSSNNNRNKNKRNQKLAKWLNWDNMKSKERDFIAQQTLLWTRNKTEVNIVDQWDSRVRHELAERYDNRVNIFDWDFNFQLLDYTQLLRFPEYREFRKIGQAFDYCRINPRRGFRYDYTVPNKSLALFNSRSSKGSYLGDVKIGPFFAIGQDTENSNMKKREVDGTTIYGCGVIAMHTVRGWLYELLTGNPFPVDIQHKHAWEDDKHYNTLPKNSPEPHVGFEPEVAPCSFKMIGLDLEKFLEKIVREEDSGKFFDAAFVGSTCTQFMYSKNFFKAMNSSHGVVVAETLKFVVDANEVAKSQFEGKIVSEIASAVKWEKNDALTEELHKNQLKPKERPKGVELDNTARKAMEHQSMNHAVVLTPSKK